MADYEYAETLAAKLLSEGLRIAATERGLSVRQIGKLLDTPMRIVFGDIIEVRKVVHQFSR